MRTRDPTSPLDLRGAPRTRWRRPVGTYRLTGHRQAAPRRVTRPCRGAPGVLSCHALLPLLPRSLLLPQGCLSFPFVTPFSGPNKKALLVAAAIVVKRAVVS